MKHAIEHELQAAKEKLCKAHFHNSLLLSIASACDAAPVILALTIVGLLVAKTFRFVPFGVVATGVLAVIAFGTVLALRWIAERRRFRITAADVAERLDLAIDDENRIASALDLAGEKTDSLFGRAAMADGLARLQEARLQTPVLPVTPIAFGRRLGVLAVAVLLAGMCGVWSVYPTMPGEGSQAGFAMGMNPAGMPNTGEPSQSPPEPDAKRTDRVAPQTADERSGQNESQKAVADTQAVGKSSLNSGGQESSKARMSSTSSESAGSASGGSGAAGEAAVAPAQSRKAGPESSETTAAESSTAERASNVQSQGATASLNGEPRKLKKFNRTSSAGASRNGSAANAEAESAASEPQSGSGQPNDGNNRTRSSGETDSGSMSNQPGQGKSSGQSPPKKSRGVPPNMNGQRLADTVLAAPMVGPDERKSVLLPPGRQASESAALASVSPGEVTESSATSYSVPLEDLAVVDRYFERLHSK